MKNFFIIILFLILCFGKGAYAQSEIDSSILSSINKLSLTEIDFEKFNNLNFADIERYAFLAFIQKDYQTAAKYYLYIVNNNADDATSSYNLSCCYARMNQPELAGYFLILAINAGYNNFDQIFSEESYKLISENGYFKDVLYQVSNYSDKFGHTIYAEAKVLIKSKVILPKKFEPTNTYSLIVGLHGYGGNAENFTDISKYLKSDRYIMVVPEAPYLLDNGGAKTKGFSWDFGVNDVDLWKKADPGVTSYILNVIDEMCKNYKIDKKYILGFSQGVAYAYSTALKNSDIINGVIAFGGRLTDTSKYPWFLSEDELKNGSSVDVFIAHGKNDKAVDYKKAIEAKKRLREHNYNVELLLFEGGHAITEEVFVKAIEWIEKQ